MTYTIQEGGQFKYCQKPIGVEADLSFRPPYCHAFLVRPPAEEKREGVMQNQGAAEPEPRTRTRIPSPSPRQSDTCPDLATGDSRAFSSRVSVTDPWFGAGQTILRPKQSSVLSQPTSDIFSSPCISRRESSHPEELK
jgi:hypothetical protein